MKNQFYRKTIIMNYILIGFFVAMIMFASIYYKTANMLWLLILLGIVFVIKLKRIKSKKVDFDERSEVIYYKALSIGFYCMLFVVLFFYCLELVSNNGIISIRTTVELLASVSGYLVSLIFLRRKY